MLCLVGDSEHKKLMIVVLWVYVTSPHVSPCGRYVCHLRANISANSPDTSFSQSLNTLQKSGKRKIIGIYSHFFGGLYQWDKLYQPDFPDKTRPYPARLLPHPIAFE